MAHVSRCCLAFLSAAFTIALTGCSLTATAPSSPVTGPAIKGSVYGGQQPVVGAHVYVLAANTAGYNTSGPTYASVSLLQAASGTTKDSSGNYYVTTGSLGGFSISNDYSCTPGQQVYLYAVGGNSGYGTTGSTNSAIGLMAILGSCPAIGNFATATPIVQMTEVTTVAAAYAMAGFAYDATHVSSSGTPLALTGVQNAFANASNLASLSTGLAYTTTPTANGGNGTVPQATINTLANILAACINSNGAVTPPVTSGPNPVNASACYTLFDNAQSGGSYGTVPTDTATAAINIAHNPGTNVATLFNLPPANSPFIPVLATQPNDFTLGITFTGGTLVGPRGIAIDGTGDVWIANSNSTGGTTGSINNIVKLSSTGAVLSGSTGFTGSGSVSLPVGIAIDASGNAWVGNYNGNSVSELSSTGQLLGSGPFTGGSIVQPWSIAIDGPGNVWVASSGSPAVVTKLSSSGGILSGSTGYTGGGLSGNLVVAVDGSANAWIGDGSSADNIVKLSSSGSVLSGANGYVVSSLPRGIAVDGLGNAWVPSTSLFEVSNSGSLTSSSTGYTSAGIKSPYYGVALDGNLNVWVANTNGSVSQFGNTGSAISPTNGYTGGQQGFGWGIAIDGSGDTWVADFTDGSITELIGAATPVITPICAGLPSTPTSNGTSSLGTRP